MAYAYENLRVTFGGQIYNTDIWSNTIHIGKENADYGLGLTSTGSELDAIADRIRQWFISPEAGISNMASLEFVKFAVLDTAGHYKEDAYLVDIEEGTLGGVASYGSVNFRPIPQQTVALTMTTDSKRGLARFGRIYPPLTGTTNDNGRINPDNMATAFKTLIERIDWELSLNLTQLTRNKVIVASNVREGQNRIVTGVKVGDVVDTQRSRRNAFKESYKQLEVNTLPILEP